MRPLIITAALTGGGSPKARTPFQPVTHDEIVAEALAAWRAGAAMIHLHARTPSGAPTSDRSSYARLCEAIRAEGCDAILNISAGDNGGQASHAERLALVDVGAEIVSLDAGSFNIGGRLYDNNPRYLHRLAAEMRVVGVKPEIEIFDTGHISTVSRLAAEGLLSPPHFVQFVAGPPGMMPPDTRILALLLEQLPNGCEWCVSAQAGDDHGTHVRLLFWAFSNGGHVRTGMEDTIWLRPGELAVSNASLVEQWVRTAELWGRPIASPAEARRMLGIPLKPTSQPRNGERNDGERRHEAVI
jgi:3-keto-5-aminohexanoate cleavage enzyme